MVVRRLRGRGNGREIGFGRKRGRWCRGGSHHDGRCSARFAHGSFYLLDFMPVFCLCISAVIRHRLPDKNS